MSYQGFGISIMRLPLVVLASVLYMGSVHAGPAGDPDVGEDVFASECSDCHSLAQGKNKKGPSLFGVIGRQSGSIADFKYSDTMKSLKTVWTVEKINTYITKPKDLVPGGKMDYKGLASEQARADVLAYIATKK